MVVDRWVTSMRRRGLSAGTVSARRGVVCRFRDYLADEAMTLATAGPDHVERWVDTVSMVPSTRYAQISHLHAFYVWAIRAGELTYDPTALIDRPRLQQRLPRPIHPADLTVAITLARGPMLAALLLAAGSGLRCCEIARLRWDDIHDGRARVIGKGNRERVVPLHPQAIPALDELARSGVYVFDGWLSAQTANPGQETSRRINAYLRGFGISATAHQLRHYAGTLAYRGSRDLRAVQLLLGHASPATTALYTALDVDDLVSVVAAIPLGASAGPSVP
jgi:integrase